jgi:hypothetical protein
MRIHDIKFDDFVNGPTYNIVLTRFHDVSQEMWVLVGTARLKNAPLFKRKTYILIEILPYLLFSQSKKVLLPAYVEVAQKFTK